MFFTSDQHFWHKAVIQFCKRPFDSVEEMNEGLIENWNRLIGPTDTVYMLGDTFFCGVQKAQSIMVRLNGKKRLIRGNHDWDLIKLNHCEKFGFESIKDLDVIDVGDHRVMLSHLPYSGDHIGYDRYPHLRPADNGGWLFCGHVHDHWRVRAKQINVGVDVWGCHPAHIDDLLLIMDEYPEGYPVP